MVIYLSCVFDSCINSIIKGVIFSLYLTIKYKYTPSITTNTKNSSWIKIMMKAGFLSRIIYSCINSTINEVTNISLFLKLKYKYTPNFYIEYKNNSSEIKIMIKNGFQSRIIDSCINSILSKVVVISLFLTLKHD